MFSNYCGDFYFVESPSGKETYIGFARSDIAASHFGKADEGSASVFPLCISRMTREASENNISAFRCMDSCKLYVLGTTSADDLVSAERKYISPQLRSLISCCPIAPDLNEDELDALSERVAQKLTDEPKSRHFFIALTEDVVSVVPDKAERDALIRKCIDAPGEAIHNIADFT